MFYLSWQSFTANKLSLLAIYVSFYSVYLTVHFLVIRDIYSNYEYFIQENDDAGIELIAETHFLCANPLCPRCGGWYFGLVTSFTLLAVSFSSLEGFLTTHPYLPYLFVTLGVIVFGLSTPAHGSLNFLRGFDRKILASDKLKLFFGFLSGLSLFLVAVGIIIIVS
jgi:hypothetical protein